MQACEPVSFADESSLSRVSGIFFSHGDSVRNLVWAGACLGCLFVSEPEKNGSEFRPMELILDNRGRLFGKSKLSYNFLPRDVLEPSFVHNRATVLPFEKLIEVGSAPGWILVRPVSNPRNRKKHGSPEIIS